MASRTDELPFEATQKSLGEVQSFTELLKAHGWERPSNAQEIQNVFAINDFSSLEDLLERVIEANEAAERMLLQSYLDYKSA